MEISARSQYHFLDRIVLSKDITNPRSLTYEETFLRTLGTNNSSAKESLSFKIYPNPSLSSSAVFITGLNQDVYKVKLFDMVGKLINEKQLQFKNKVEELEMPTLKPGMYFITFSNSKSRISTRLIIR